MTLEDQFFLSKEEVSKALSKIQEIFQTWLRLQETNGSPEVVEHTRTELRNSLRSIEWDIEDLEETLTIVENNPKKFKIDDIEIQERRNFITSTRDEVRSMKLALADHSYPSKEKNLIQTLLSSAGSDQKYTLIENKEPVYEQEQLKCDKVYQPTTLPSLEALRDLNVKMNRVVTEHSVMLDDTVLELNVVQPSFKSNVFQAMSSMRFAPSRKGLYALGAVSSAMVLVVLIVAFV